MYELCWCWFVVRDKHCWLADKLWLKPTSEHASFNDCGMKIKYASYKIKEENKTTDSSNTNMPFIYAGF